MGCAVRCSRANMVSCARASWCPEDAQDAQCESVLVSLGRAYGECENKCNTLTISTKCHTSTVSSSAKPVFPSALLCDHFNCIRGAFVLLSAKLRDSSFSIDAETLVGNALIFMQSLPRSTIIRSSTERDRLECEEGRQRYAL
ncbi:hypothetical protein PInf_007784 [Phytophthora infestans]|nr:hypothetical protein PInf_007784 [Phytophthora infestans]